MNAMQRVGPAAGYLALVLFACMVAIPADAAITSPTEIAGLQLWLDANDVDGDGTPNLPGGGTVATWADKSGAGRDFTQGTVATMPQITEDGLNGLDLLNFDGDDFLSRLGGVVGAGDDDYSYYAVWKPRTTSGLQRVYEQYEVNVANRYGAMLAINDRYGFNGQNNDRHDLVPFGGEQWRLTDMKVDNAEVFGNISIYDNATLWTGSTTNRTTLNIGDDAGTIGSKNAGAFPEFLNGHIAELIVYDSNLTFEERNDVGAYLNDKYSLGLSYPLTPPLPPAMPDLLHQWTFNGDARDQVGFAHLALEGTAGLDGTGRLQLNGGADLAVSPALGETIVAKTLVAWTSLDFLTPQNKSTAPLSIRRTTGDTFDGIVFGERVDDQWMAGSNGFQRSVPNNGGPLETAIGTEVMIAITYGADNSITIYRDGIEYASAENTTQGGLITYPAGLSNVILGKRQIGTQSLDGFVNEARIYGGVMNADQIAGVYAAGPSLVDNPLEPVHQWTFNDGTADDSIGTAHGTLQGTAIVVDGRLSVDGTPGSRMITDAVGHAIGAKTLVSWVSLNDLNQGGGSALTLQTSDDLGNTFDAVVYAERQPKQWMNGSNGFTRTDDVNGPDENVAEPDGEVMMAIVYDELGNITLYRDGVQYGTSYIKPLFTFGAGAMAQIGPRHGPHNDVLNGYINEARIYDVALNAGEIEAVYLAGPVPEPGSAVLLLAGVVGLLVARRRRR